jgi:hypothetical protein
VTPSGPDAGGSHGGPGFATVDGSAAGEVFGSVYQPALGGGGGSMIEASSTAAGAGGGALTIVAGQLVVDGLIAADGEYRSVKQQMAAGAGGSLVVEAAVVSGSGNLSARGGQYQDRNTNSATPGGSGGGGRVALIVGTFSGFDPATQVNAGGGTRRKQNDYWVFGYGGAGTVYLLQPWMTHGELWVVQQPESHGNAFSSVPRPPTPLPSVGTGVVGVAEADPDDPATLWIEPQDPQALFDLGVVGMWVRIGGADYRVLEQSDDRRRLLLEGAGGLVTVGEAYEGIYKFDAVRVEGYTTLEFRDTAEVGAWLIEDGSTVVTP